MRMTLSDGVKTVEINGRYCDALRRSVIDRFGIERLRGGHKADSHLNGRGLELEKWDDMADSIVDGWLWARLTKAEKVCLLKDLARIAIGVETMWIKEDAVCA